MFKEMMICWRQGRQNMAGEVKFHSFSFCTINHETCDGALSRWRSGPFRLTNAGCLMHNFWCTIKLRKRKVRYIRERNEDQIGNKKFEALKWYLTHLRKQRYLLK